MASPTSGPNSSKPTTAQLVGGVYNANTETLVDGQASPFQFDINGNLKTTASGGGGTSNVNIADVSGNPPALNNPLPVELSDGTNAFGTAGNPLSVNVITGGGSNASVGATGATAPTSATEIGVIDGTGKLQGASSTNPVRIDPTGTTTQPVSGTVTANQGTANTLANAWPSKITDATNGPAAVKPASTAAVATDPALVVAISPNNALTVTASGTVTANQGTAAATTAGWPTLAGQTAESTAAWTSATTVNTTLALNCAGYATAVVTILSTSTLTGGVLTFEGSDTTAFTNAYAVTAYPFNPTNAATDFSQVTTSVALSGTAGEHLSFYIPLAGLASVRIRLSTVISGTGTTSVGIALSSAAITPSVSLVRSTINAGAVADNLSSTSAFPSANSAVAFPMGVASEMYGGAFSGTADTARQGWSKARMPTVFKTVQATASGNTAAWTPGSGNKFRLLAYRIILTDNVATSGGAVITVSFQDSTTGMPIAHDVYVPAAAIAAPVGAAYDSGFVSLGSFGILSAAANNVLNVNLSAALSAGNARIQVAGTEE